MREGGQKKCCLCIVGTVIHLAVVVIAHLDWLAAIRRADDCSVWFVVSVCRKHSAKQISV